MDANGLQPGEPVSGAAQLGHDALLELRRRQAEVLHETKFPPKPTETDAQRLGKMNPAIVVDQANPGTGALHAGAGAPPQTPTMEVLTPLTSQLHALGGPPREQF